MSRILIVGASGYIGARLSYLLSENGHKITALCFPKSPIDKVWLSKMEKVVIGDITSKSIIDKITDTKFDVAIYLVSLNHNESNKSPDFVNSINVMPVWNILESFKRKKTLKKFIYFSTVHVYGIIPSKIIDESFCAIPKTPYGLTHFMAENIGNMYNASSTIHCINLRLTNSYGSPFFKENSCWWLVVNDLCRKAYLENKIILKSDGSALRDFIHYNDIFGAVNLLITNAKKEKNNTFHISSGQTLSIFNLAKKIKQVYKKRYRTDIPIIFPEGVKVSKSEEKYKISNKKLTKIGIKKMILLEDGINEVFEYLEKNG